MADTEAHRRRTRALSLMERLKQHEIEEEARELGLLRAKVARLEERRDALSGRLRDETYVSSFESAPYVAAFVRSVRGEIAQAEEELAGLKPRSDALEAKVAEAFREKKTYEIVRLRAVTRRHDERVARERAEEEEIALIRWARARGPRGRGGSTA